MIAVMLFLGIEDNAPNYAAACGQGPGGPCGVRVVIETGEV